MDSINPFYVDTTMMEKIALVIDQENSVLLQDFFTKNTFEKLRKTLNQPFFEQKDPLHYCFAESKLPVETLEEIEKILPYLLKIINKKDLLVKKATVQSFGWKNYTLLHDTNHNKAGIDIFVQLNDWDYKAGGRVVYIDENGQNTPLEPPKNSILIFRREEKTQRFIQYINHYAKNSKKIFILLQLS